MGGDGGGGSTSAATSVTNASGIAHRLDARPPDARSNNRACRRGGRADRVAGGVRGERDGVADQLLVAGGIDQIGTAVRRWALLTVQVLDASTRR